MPDFAVTHTMMATTCKILSATSAILALYVSMKPRGGLRTPPLFMKKTSITKIDFQAIWNKKKTGKWKMTLADSPPLHPYYGILFSIIFLYIFLTLP